MAILLNFGVAAPLQNYDVTSRASNDAGFCLNFNTRVFSPKYTILPSLEEWEQIVVFFGIIYNIHMIGILINTLMAEGYFIFYFIVNKTSFLELMKYFIMK